jgi:hypothetical protein
MGQLGNTIAVHGQKTQERRKTSAQTRHACVAEIQKYEGSATK